MSGHLISPQKWLEDDIACDHQQRMVRMGANMSGFATQQLARRRRERVAFDYAMTHEEIAAELGTTRGAINLLERSALRKARRILDSRGYDALMLVSLLRTLASPSEPHVSYFGTLPDWQ